MMSEIKNVCSKSTMFKNCFEIKKKIIPIWNVIIDDE